MNKCVEFLWFGNKTTKYKKIYETYNRKLKNR